MPQFDFDIEIQKYFNNFYADIDRVNWEKWLDISSSEEYLELALKLSGLSSIDGLFDRLNTETTESKKISLNLSAFLSSYGNSSIPILCHTSGTTNNKISALKWFHMSKAIVKRNWAPGMQAIFESSGLNRNSSAVIFVPSRIKFDGLKTFEGQRYISLYSSEFSQRVMLSIIKPKAFSFYEYKNSKNLDVIAKILSLEGIAVISAPALTILGWADLEKLQTGIKNSLENLPKEKNSILEKFLSIIERKGIEKASEIIQNKLSEKLSEATLIFSISSLSEQNWSLIRKFMKWKKGNERFTNLYVASEIGPFAASISKGDFKLSHLNRMYVFPLTIPILEYKNKRRLISEVSNQIGKLFISRMGNKKALININVGDIITAMNSEGLPQIDGKIIRSSFQLNYKLKLSKKVEVPYKHEILAGDYFSLNELIINQPRNLVNCLKLNCNLQTDALLLIKRESNSWELVLPLDLKSSCVNATEVLETILKCPTQADLYQAIRNKSINLKFIEDLPVDFLATREAILKKVREGQIPKGILKKWPLYVISPC
ncbi:MAG: hypothetical protein ACFFBH_07350 [Promethearchaeota archaeon]